MNRRRRVVVVTPSPPRRDAPHGGGRLTAEAVEHLAAEFEVSLLTLRAEDEDGTDERLLDACALVEEVARERVGASAGRLWSERRRVWLTVRGRPPWAVGHAVSALRHRLDELVCEHRPDVVQLEYLVLADLVSALSPPRPPVVLVEHDARPAPSTGAEWRWRALRREAARNVQAIVAFTEEDAGIVRRDAGATPVVVIRPGLDLPARAGSSQREEIVFVGGSRHPPNVDAVQRLVREIHPRVRRDHPGAVLTLVGDSSPGLVAGDGVVIEGRVADARPYVERAAVVVAPLQQGGGIRVKVLDALASGKAVVATSCALQGIDVRAGEHVMLAETRDETADAISTLLADRGLRDRLGTAARTWAERELRWEDRIEQYGTLYESLLAGGGTQRNDVDVPRQPRSSRRRL